jgi:hypothetical protein
MPITRGFNHVATLTADLGRLVRLYQDAFDATIDQFGQLVCPGDG